MEELEVQVDALSHYVARLESIRTLERAAASIRSVLLNSDAD